MPRITRDGRTFHPDEVRAGAVEAPPADDGPDAAQLEAERLEAAGWSKDETSNWWTGPEGERVNGRRVALEHLEG